MAHCKNANAYLYALAFFPLFLVLMVLTPPAQSPDEMDHFQRAYLLSTGQMFLETREDVGSGGMVDRRLLKYFDVVNKIPFHVNQKMLSSDREKQETLQWSNKKRFMAFPGTGYYIPVIYTPSAMGILIGRKLNLSIASTYLTSRIFVLTTTILLIATAFLVYSPPVLVVSILLMPMTLFQLIAVSIDGMSFALAILTASLFLHLATERDAGTRGKRLKFLALIISAGILVTCRQHMLPLLFLPVYLIYADFSDRRFRIISTGFLIALTILWIGFALQSTVDLRVPRVHSTGECIRYYILAPFEFLHRVWITLKEKHLFYIKSFIGILGWLDTPLDDKTYRLWYGFLIFSAIISFSYKFRRAETGAVLLSITGIISFLLVFFLLLITRSVIDADTIIPRIQGRYFWISLLFLSYGIAESYKDMSRWRQYLYVMVCFITGSITIYSMADLLLRRYYMS